MGNETSTEVVENPDLPYTGRILTSPGHRSAEVIIHGRVPRHCSRFFINFLDADDEAALQFKVRFGGQPGVVLRRYRNNRWHDKEEHRCLFPFKQGERFVVKFILTGCHSEIFINEDHFTNYDLDIETPRDHIRKLNIPCGVDISKIIFEGEQSKDMPMNEMIPIKLKARKIIKIYGRCESHCGAKMFRLNLVHGRGYEHGADIAICFEAHFDDDKCGRHMLFNYRQTNQWGPAIKTAVGSNFPFSPGEAFELTLKFTKTFCRFEVGGNHVFDFPYRLFPMCMYNHLYIDGDVSISRALYLLREPKREPVPCHC